MVYLPASRLPFSCHFGTVLAAMALLIACGDDAGGDDGTDGSSSSSSDSTGGAPSSNSNADTTGDPSGTTAAEGADSSGDDPGSSDDADSSDSGSESTTGSAFEGVCLGFDQVATIVTVLGLDGANPPGNCDVDIDPCGGDIVGSWTFEDTCGHSDIPSPFDCETQTFEASVDDLSGTVVFVDDGTFSQMVMNTGTLSVELDPMECFGFNCAAWEVQLQGQDPAWTCEFTDPDCACELITMTETDTTGTWENDGNGLILTVDDTAQELEYCVDGNRLDLIQPVDGVTVTEEPCADDAECEAALGDTHESYACFEIGG